MTYVPDSFDTLPRMPSWVTSGRAETPEDVAFLSGAALNHLHLVLSREDVPHTLLRARLALRAAEVCVAHSGRPERAAALRDAVAFLQPGDSPGPAGEVYQSWRRAIERPVSVDALHRALPDLEPEQIATWLDGCDPRGAAHAMGATHAMGAGQGAPISWAAGVLQAIIADRPRDLTAALILADAALAQSLGWSHVVPLLALKMKRPDLGKTGEDLRLACYRAVLAAAAEATREAADLARRMAKVRALAPKLRAKGADGAVALFLNRDAVAPNALTSLRSDRAARRFCDRLVELGAVRELTGRDTFRLYGL
ncbi:DUF1403 family protein [Tateyamaria sp. SN6-1]|uniref:DUF1403 family protein n=1 Tax=Tateyamaria sp. SN6-1 TaxID=3092148 RepID=UPI0039F5BC2A